MSTESQPVSLAMILQESEGISELLRFADAKTIRKNLRDISRVLATHESPEFVSDSILLLGLVSDAIEDMERITDQTAADVAA